MMGKKFKRNFLALSFSLIVMLFVAFVLAVGTASIQSPISYGNYSSTMNITVNLTFINISAATFSYNVTVFYNTSTEPVDETSTILVTMWNETAGAIVLNATEQSISGIDDGTYNITALADNGTDRAWSIEAEEVTFDSTPPAVTNFTNTTAYSNFSSNTIYLNVSIVDATMGTVHNDVFFNITNSSGKQNYSLTANASGAGYFHNNLTINVTKFVEGKYNITVWANDTQLGNLNNTEAIQITIDRTSPWEINFTSQVTRGNYSGTITFNSSVLDALSTAQTVTFNITNVTGKQNATASATKSGSYYYASFNTSHVPDGTYNITVWSTDASGNANNTKLLQDVVVDNTAPALSIASVSTKDSITFTITITETGSGMGSECSAIRSGTSQLVSGETGTSQTIAATGLSCGTEYSYTIDCADLAGVNGTSTASYSTTVCSSGSSSSGGGGSSSAWTNTFTIHESKLESGYTRQLGSKQRIKFKVDGTYHSLGVTGLTSKTATIEVSSEKQTLILSPGQTEKIEVTDDNYYDLSVTLNEIKSNKADFTVLLIHEYFETPSLAPEDEEVVASTAADEEAAAEKEKSWAWLWILIAVLVVIVVIWIIVKRKSN